jgi:hypothetical protein
MTVFRSKNRQLMRVSLLIHLHVRKITACTVFVVPDNVKNNETRGTVFLKYNEGDSFCNFVNAK